MISFKPASTVHIIKTCISRPSSRTNYRLARFSVETSQTWETIPIEVKCLPYDSFKRYYNMVNFCSYYYCIHVLLNKCE